MSNLSITQVVIMVLAIVSFQIAGLAYVIYSTNKEVMEMEPSMNNLRVGDYLFVSKVTHNCTQVPETDYDTNDTIAH